MDVPEVSTCDMEVDEPAVPKTPTMWDSADLHNVTSGLDESDNPWVRSVRKDTSKVEGFNSWQSCNTSKVEDFTLWQSCNDTSKVEGPTPWQTLVSVKPCQSADMLVENAQTSSTSPNESERKRTRFVGAALYNMGNTCFLNATLQCITHTVSLIEKLCYLNHQSPCPRDEEDFCSICALKEHIHDSINGAESVLTPARFGNNLNKLSSDFSQGQQQDAQEFLMCFLDHLQKCCSISNKTSQSSLSDENDIISQVFGGLIRSQSVCCECGHCSDRSEAFLDLSLEIDKVESIVDALESFTSVEKMDQDNKVHCDGCDTEVCKDKQLKLEKAPQVIALHLKRFAHAGPWTTKISKHVAYPLELDLTPFHCCPEKEEQLQYDLYGVVEHYGSPNFGHYLSYIRCSPCMWHQLNDFVVAPISEDDAMQQQAYLLFYIKKGSSPWFSSFIEDGVAALDMARTSPVSVLECENSVQGATSSAESGSCSHERFESARECSSSAVNDGVHGNDNMESAQCSASVEDLTSAVQPPSRIQKIPLPKHHIIDNMESARCSTSIEDLASALQPPSRIHKRPLPNHHVIDNMDSAQCSTSIEDLASAVQPPSRIHKKPLPTRHIIDMFNDEEVYETLDGAADLAMVKLKQKNPAKKQTTPVALNSARRVLGRMPVSRRSGLLNCLKEQQDTEERMQRNCRSHPPRRKQRVSLEQH